MSVKRTMPGHTVGTQLTVLFYLTPLSALTAIPVTVNLNRDGSPIADPSGVPLTFRLVVGRALDAVDSKKLSPLKQIKLALKIDVADEVDLDGDECEAVKAAVAGAFLPLIGAQVASLVEDGKELIPPANPGAM